MLQTNSTITVDTSSQTWVLQLPPSVFIELEAGPGISLSGSNPITISAAGPPVVTVTQSATPAIDSDNCRNGYASITGLAQAITSMSTNLTGTPVDGQSMIVRLTDNGTGRALTWGAGFEASTVASTLLLVGFVWNVVTSKWRCVAVA
jgi:hypothetical protein